MENKYGTPGYGVIRSSIIYLYLYQMSTIIAELKKIANKCILNICAYVYSLSQNYNTSFHLYFSILLLV
jgi:hypothetical protein